MVKQDSSKDRNGADQVGQYGTGFMATHAFNRLVYVNGPFVVKTGKDTIKGYVQVKNFELDRTLVDTADGPIKMKEQLEKVKQFWKGDLLGEISDDTTSFRYDLTLCKLMMYQLNCQVYELVKVVMGDDSKKLYDPAYLDICEVNPYSQSDLQRAIASTMGIWRTSALINQDKTALTDEQLTAMITFCSASYLPEFNNIRGRMMPLIAKFYGKDYKILSIIKFKEEKEEDFYSATFNLLLDYTLFLLSQKDTIWVSANKDWLKSFLIEYSPSTNEEHKKRLDDYGILPNQKGKLCLMKDLHKNNGVPSEMATIYLSIFGSDLHESWIDADFENIVSLTEDKPEDIARKDWFGFGAGGEPDKNRE